jgi:ferredoxin-NADP reductase
METMTTTHHTTARRIASGIARRLLLDRQAEFWLSELAPTRSLGEIRARVIAIVTETPDAKTFVLRPNRGWRGHLAGQHTTIEVEIDGVRVRRCYSISSAPGDELPAITVKRALGGRVSGWLHDHVRPGHVLRLAPAAGDFVLPQPMPRKLLMLSGGSGITPLMSMLRDLAGQGPIADLVFVHHARCADDVIFRSALGELAARHRGLRLLCCLGDSTSGPGRFDEAQLRRLVPDLAERETFLCGPPGLMERVERLWAEAGATRRLHLERFVSPAVPALVASGEGGGGTPVTVALTRSGRSFTARSGTLLEQLERAGERPASGCRMGICQTCKCRKRTGRVENLLSGAVSSEPDEDIQPCISVARSDLELCL